MSLQIIFVVSGILILLLIAAKVWEEKNRKPFFLLKAISKGDERIRELSIRSTHGYADLKEKGKFVVGRQIPLHSKNLVNKTSTFLHEKSIKYLSGITNKKNEGIGEFLKDISDMEKGVANEEVIEKNKIDSQNTSNKVK